MLTEFEKELKVFEERKEDLLKKPPWKVRLDPWKPDT